VIITRTPYRISLLGGGTDHKEWLAHNSSSVLSFTINHYSYLNARVPTSISRNKYKISYAIIEEGNSYKDFSHLAFRKGIEEYHPDPVEIHHHGDLPSGSGLGSSSAFSVGLIKTLKSLAGQTISRTKLAKEAIRFEQEILCERVGLQDQIACTFGGINQIHFHNPNSWSVNPIKIKDSTIDILNDSLILVHSGVTRKSGEVQAHLTDQMEMKYNYFKEMSTLCNTGVNALLRGTNLNILGEIIQEGWNLKKLMNPNSTNSKIEDIFYTAKKLGAVGGKVLGAGGGGFLLFWVPKPLRKKFIEGIFPLPSIPFQIEFSGVRRLL
jgi:D-glycero-alpha-D-manno-heptose-7-phosphate kinase